MMREKSLAALLTLAVLTPVSIEAAFRPKEKGAAQEQDRRDRAKKGKKDRPGPSRERPGRERADRGGERGGPDLRVEGERLREHIQHFLGMVRERWMNLPPESRERLHRRAEEAGESIRRLLEEGREAFLGGSRGRPGDRKPDRGSFGPRKDGESGGSHPFMDRLRERMNEWRDRRGGDRPGPRPGMEGEGRRKEFGGAPPPPEMRERLERMSPGEREGLRRKFQEMPEGERRERVERFLRERPGAEGKDQPGKESAGPEKKGPPPGREGAVDEFRGRFKEMMENQRRMMERLEKLEMRMKEQGAPKEKSQDKKEGALPAETPGVL